MIAMIMIQLLIQVLKKFEGMELTMIVMVK